MNVLNNFPLRPLNSFGIESTAKYFISCNTLETLYEVCESALFRNSTNLILGGGSNILFTKDFDGLVIQPCLKGLSITEQNNQQVKLRVMAGEGWDGLVAFAVEHGFGGLENLSLIPGTVGSSPIQNIGAYGVEVKDTIESVEVLNLETLRVEILTNAACAFGYRDSIFKRALKNKVIVLSVTYSLNLDHTLVTGYGNVEQELARYPVINISTVREAIIAIRRRKLPDPLLTGNAGSFFKNPALSAEKAAELKGKYNTMPGYAQGDRSIKVPAAWMIEQCGWKGFRKGDAGVHPNQPLVLVNYGSATGHEIVSLAGNIRDSVMRKFGIPLEFEVNII